MPEPDGPWSIWRMHARSGHQKAVCDLEPLLRSRVMPERSTRAMGEYVAAGNGRTRMNDNVMGDGRGTAPRSETTDGKFLVTGATGLAGIRGDSQVERHAPPAR